MNLENLLEHKDEYKIMLSNTFNELHVENNEKVTEIINQVNEQAELTGGKSANQKSNKIKQSTKNLMKKRREMKQGETFRNNIEYIEICKTIRKKIKADIREYNTKVVANAISNNTGLKKATQKVKAHKNLITSIKNPHGSVLETFTKLCTPKQS